MIGLSLIWTYCFDFQNRYKVSKILTSQRHHIQFLLYCDFLGFSPCIDEKRVTSLKAIVTSYFLVSRLFLLKRFGQCGRNFFRNQSFQNLFTLVSTVRSKMFSLKTSGESFSGFSNLGQLFPILWSQMQGKINRF